jgi:hypothetical protein
VFLVVTTKTPQALCHAISQENSPKLGWGNSLPELHLPSCGRIFPYVDAKYSTLGTRGLLFQAFVFLTSSKHTNPHWLVEPQSDQKNWLHVAKEINSLWPEKYTIMINDCLVFPTQWNCYHLSSEWQLSGTPESVEYHEALGKDIHFSKDSLGDKTLQLSFMELNTYSWSSSRLLLKGTSGIQPISTNQWMANWTRISNTHTHKKWWYPDCYLVNELLNFCLLNSNIGKDQKSLNTRTPWCILPIPTVLKRDFDSRSLVHD